MGQTGSCCQEEEAIPVEVVGPVSAFKSEKVQSLQAEVLEKVRGQDVKLTEPEPRLCPLAVDVQLVRGLPLHSTLRGAGRLWRRSPLDMPEKQRAGLWERSQPAECLDVFLSHTWLTPGRWKVLSLMLQLGWRPMLVIWLLMMAVLPVMVKNELLPMPFITEQASLDFKGECPWFPWLLMSGALALILGMLMVPYIPGQRTMCFLDVACIHQVDPDLMKRGIYGLGGFLKLSKELRVLWSPPYLTRLWCVFELAAYRKANPRGKITFAPLFVESTVVVLIVGGYLASALLQVLFVFQDVVRVNLFLATFLGLAPVYVMVHMIRKYNQEKRQLFLGLEHFDLKSAFCRNELDKEFIYTAIREWYGSEDAFMDYVRGPLRQELLAMTSMEVSLPYLLLMATGPMSSSTDGTVARWMAHAPAHSLVAHVAGYVIPLTGLWFIVSMKLVLKLCDRFAAPWRRFDHLQTLGIFLAYCLFFCLGAAVSEVVTVHSVEASCVWFFFSVVLAAFVTCRYR